MIPPESAYKRYWDNLIICLVMYNTLFIILVVCYNRYDERGLYWYESAEDTLNVTPMVIDYLIDIMFFMDIYLTFHTTFFDAENELVLDKKVIAKKYLSWWFTIDLIATLPFEILGFLWPPHRLVPQLKVIRLVRFTKVLKQFTIGALNTQLARYPRPLLIRLHPCTRAHAVPKARHGTTL